MMLSGCQPTRKVRLVKRSYAVELRWNRRFLPYVSLWEFAIWPYNSAQDEYSTAQGSPLLGDPLGADPGSPIRKFIAGVGAEGWQQKAGPMYKYRQERSFRKGPFDRC